MCVCVCVCVFVSSFLEIKQENGTENYGGSKYYGFERRTIFSTEGSFGPSALQKCRGDLWCFSFGMKPNALC